MDSQTSTRFYDGATLWALAQAFRKSWAATKARDPRRNSVRDHELRNALVDKLLELADEGLRDPAELEKLALESFRADANDPDDPFVNASAVWTYSIHVPHGHRAQRIRRLSGSRQKASKNSPAFNTPNREHHPDG